MRRLESTYWKSKLKQTVPDNPTLCSLLMDMPFDKIKSHIWIWIIFVENHNARSRPECVLPLIVWNITGGCRFRCIASQVAGCGCNSIDTANTAT